MPTGSSYSITSVRPVVRILLRNNTKLGGFVPFACVFFCLSFSATCVGIIFHRPTKKNKRNHQRRWSSYLLSGHPSVDADQTAAHTRTGRDNPAPFREGKSISVNYLMAFIISHRTIEMTQLITPSALGTERELLADAITICSNVFFP